MGSKTKAKTKKKTIKKIARPARKETPKPERETKGRTTRKEPKPTPVARPAKVPGYKGHNPGSRKERVHQVFDEKGSAAAITLGAEIGLAAGTIRSWMGTWTPQEVKERTRTTRAVEAERFPGLGAKVDDVVRDLRRKHPALRNASDLDIEEIISELLRHRTHTLEQIISTRFPVTVPDLPRVRPTRPSKPSKLLKQMADIIPGTLPARVPAFLRRAR